VIKYGSFVLDVEDILKLSPAIYAQSNKETPVMKVKTVMTESVESCRPETDLGAIAMIMWDNDCGAVPVVDDANRVVGMITDRDICMASAMQGRRPSELRAADAMAREVRTTAAEAEMDEALEVMSREQLRRLPVVDGDGVLAGILSLSDIVRHSDKGKSKKHISHKEAIETLKAISEPHELKRPATASAAPELAAVAGDH
jgi:CBS domain-containing protein